MFNQTFQMIQSIHQSIYPRFRKNNLNLRAATNCRSVAGSDMHEDDIITYLRPQSQLEVIERMMGCEGRSLNLRRHPVIELRQTHEGIALELIIAPDAWWDQRNFVAKLSLKEQSRTFRRLLAEMSDEFVIGFWHGLHLDEQHITTSQAAHPAVFYQLMSTYTDRDWFRIGVWYNAEEIHDDIHLKLFDHIKDLHRLYDFIAWTSNNDFRVFSDKDSDVAYA